MRNPFNRPDLELPPEFPIVVENLTVIANETTLALSGLSLTIESGEFVGIIGPNSSGKSTYENMILGLGGGVLKMTSGTVKYGDLDIYQKPMRERDRTLLRSRFFGYVPQEAELALDITAEQNIRRPYNLMGRKLDKNAIGELAERFGISDKLDQPARALSGGLRQRVNIVRGLVGDPRIAVLDEPTKALDADSKPILAEELRSYAHDANKTVIVVTHEEIGADRLVTLSGGKLKSDTNVSGKGLAA